MKQKLHFKTMISFTSYLSSMEKSVTHDLLPKRKRMNLGVTLALVSFPTVNTAKPRKLTIKASSNLPISFLFTHLGENQSLKKKVIERT